VVCGGLRYIKRHFELVCGISKVVCGGLRWSAVFRQTQLEQIKLDCNDECRQPKVVSP